MIMSFFSYFIPHFTLQLEKKIRSDYVVKQVKYIHFQEADKKQISTNFF